MKRKLTALVFALALSLTMAFVPPSTTKVEAMGCVMLMDSTTGNIVDGCIEHITYFRCGAEIYAVTWYECV